VANILGVTATDPVANGLLFERFLHRDRIMPPDLDIDLPSGERDLLMEWAIDRFGRERVAQVSAHQTFGRRAAFREGLKALGMGRSRLERFFERFPEDGLELAHSPIPVHLLEGKLRDAVPLLNRLIGRFRHLSVHPGALVFAEPRIDSYSALERAPKGVLVTQYDIHSLEQLGIVKIDLLGNRALSAIQEMTSPPNETRLIPSQDEATLETLRRAETIGCFQIETPPMRAVLRKLPIRSVEDLRNALAIVRPGPGSGEDKASFIRRAHGEESASPPHPRLAGVLHDSLGMLLYEEDVIRAISALTGWTVERADELRRQLLRVDPHEASHLECKFAGAATAAGLAPREARDLWRLLLRFVAYTFNKAHACEYARLAWEMAFLKTHRPLEFSCAVLNHYAGHYPLRTLAADFMRNGARFLLPHVNCAADVCVLEDGAVRIGLGFVKHLTRASLARILLRRPFSDWRDLLERVPLNVREKEALVFSGACDGLAPLDAEAYPYAHEQVMNAIRRDARATSFVIAPFRTSGAHARTFAALVRAHHEMKYLDMHVSDHPLHVLRNEAQREGCTPIANLTAGKRETIAALVAASRRTPASRGRLMQFVTFEDETGLVEATLLPETFLRLEDPIRNPGPYLVEGRGQEDHGQLQWFVSEVKPFFERSRPYEDE
jgi:DNA polymerase III alpha subunit